MEISTEEVSLGGSGLSIERPAVYVVATPIGNLADITLRALDVLRAVDFILCEDTRHSRVLMQQYAIGTSLRSHHEHNERSLAAEVIELLRDGRKACALISDAGTPLISDPGHSLIVAAAAADIPVFSVPGACAAIAALSISALPVSRFVFEGFLPTSAGARQRRLESLSDEARTMIFYEAPHRVRKTLEDMSRVFGEERKITVAREMTKRFESLYAMTLGEMSERFRKEPEIVRGEFVILLDGSEVSAGLVSRELLLKSLARHLEPRAGMTLARELTGLSRNELYRYFHDLEPGRD